jgi:hypothetical protein
MPPKKDIIYPRYFQSSDPQDRTTFIVFPSEGSLGTSYYTDLKRWANLPAWRLSEMRIAPEDIEVLRWQAIALGVPSELPPFRSEEYTDKL